MGGTAETVLGLIAILIVAAALALFMTSRSPTRRLAALGLILLAGVLAWLAWADIWPAA